MLRVKTGIEGLDAMLDGGIPYKRHVILCGGPGCGKTSIGMNFLYNGAKGGENGLFVTFEESAEKILENIKQAFPGWTDIDRLIKEKKLTILKIDPLAGDTPQNGFTNVVEVLLSTIRQREAKRVVVDSTTILKMTFYEEDKFRKRMFGLLEILNDMDANVIFTVEIPTTAREDFAYTPEQFFADGIIALYNLPMKEKRISAIEVIKMRGTSHSKKVCPFLFTPKGVAVYLDQKIY